MAHRAEARISAWPQVHPRGGRHDLGANTHLPWVLPPSCSKPIFSFLPHQRRPVCSEIYSVLRRSACGPSPPRVQVRVVTGFPGPGRRAISREGRWVRYTLVATRVTAHGVAKKPYTCAPHVPVRPPPPARIYAPFLRRRPRCVSRAALQIQCTVNLTSARCSVNHASSAASSTLTPKPFRDPPTRPLHGS